MYARRDDPTSWRCIGGGSLQRPVRLHRSDVAMNTRGHCPTSRSTINGHRVMLRWTTRWTPARRISYVRLATKTISRLSPDRRLTPGISVLAIESSCDDSSVAVLTLDDGSENGHTGPDRSLRSVVNFHKTVTARSEQYNGIHPLVALSSHHAALANLVHKACAYMRSYASDWKPTLVAATRGPGMRSNLAVGLSVAKGLSIAWQVPLVGVHHMQAHALTPRLCWTLADGLQAVHDCSKTWTSDAIEPDFPYLSVLVSGGHTMLLQSNSLTEHSTLAETQDIALGDCLDKAARAILPPSTYKPPYGRALESYAFPDGEADYNYRPAKSRAEDLEVHSTPWGWALRPLLQDKSGEKTSRRMSYSFSGLLSSVERIMGIQGHPNGREYSRAPGDIAAEERRDLAREVLRVCFEHLASRIILHLTAHQDTQCRTVVLSGGVASNHFLRHVIRKMLDARGFGHVQAIFPPVELCTDNALMIAWAGLEMYAAGYTTSLDVEPIRKWSMDTRTGDGGILAVPGWIRDES